MPDRYQKENDKILETLFERQFFRRWTKENTHGSIEIIVTADCDQKCEYCYLHRHGEELYPHALRDRETILHNLDLVLEWLVRSGYYVYTLDLFSGELFAGKLGFEVLEAIYQKARGADFFHDIVVPSNFSFIADEKRTAQVESYLEKFQALGKRLHLSCSVDGKVIDGRARETWRQDYRTDAYYDRVFEFCKKHDCGFHPMVGEEFVSHYRENFDWWVEMLLKHFGPEEAKYRIPMMLEIRNDTWTTSALKDYAEMLWYVAERCLQAFHGGDVKDFIHRLFHVPGRYENVTMGDILKLPYTTNRMTCAVQFSPVVRLGDLKLVPCHRTMYPELCYGELLVEDGRIAGMREQNLPLASKIYSMNPNATHPKCSGCEIRSICLRGCLGAQLEVTGELFAPIPSVCDLMYTKLHTLYCIYEHYGAFRLIENDQSIPPEFKRRVRSIKGVLERI